MSEPAGEKFIGDMVGRIDPDDPPSLKFRLSDYQVFDPEMATVTFVYGGEGQQGIVLWNLEPGQENDYHLHPTTGHLHIMVEGTAEYTLAGSGPVKVTTGEAVMVPAGIPHGIRNVSSDRCTYLAITSPGPYEKVLVDRD
jgi:quercetin dioxygenase-like cupin family protein